MSPRAEGPQTPRRAGGPARWGLSGRGTTAVLGAVLATVLLLRPGFVRAAHCAGSTATPPGSSAGLVADCEALLGLKDALIGTGAGSLNWDKTRVISLWNGVIIEEAIAGATPQVTELRLQKRKVTGMIPAAFGALRALHLRTNPLTGAHATPSSGPRIHSGEAGPILLAGGPNGLSDAVTPFHERAVISGGLGHIRRADVMPLLRNAPDCSRFSGVRHQTEARPDWQGRARTVEMQGLK